MTDEEWKQKYVVGPAAGLAAEPLPAPPIAEPKVVPNNPDPKPVPAVEIMPPRPRRRILQ